MQVRKDHHGHHSNFKYATMDEACVPGELGGWKENYDKRQKKFNAFLVAGVVSLGVTIYTVSKNKNNLIILRLKLFYLINIFF